MTVVIDYGVGNLFSLRCSLEKIGETAIVTADPAVLETADRLILPGVGAFGDAMDKLNATGLVPVIKEQVRRGKPVLGICLGMQLLFDKSYEYGEHTGLSLIKGEIRPLSERVQGLKIPHMGWNALQMTNETHPLFRYIKNGDAVYFVHSFCAVRCESDTIAFAEYGVPVTAAVAKENVYGFQFHPEKSGNVGLSLLKAFCETGGAVC